MRYQLAPIFCRPWLLNGLSKQLIESHYENNYGGALRRAERNHGKARVARLRQHCTVHRQQSEARRTHRP